VLKLEEFSHCRENISAPAEGGRTPDATKDPYYTSVVDRMMFNGRTLLLI
jgi:hypothetical protein